MTRLCPEALLRSERCGFKVACCTLDGNSVNRKAFKDTWRLVILQEIKCYSHLVQWQTYNTYTYSILYRIRHTFGQHFIILHTVKSKCFKNTASVNSLHPRRHS